MPSPCHRIVGLCNPFLRTHKRILREQFAKMSSKFPSRSSLSHSVCTVSLLPSSWICLVGDFFRIRSHVFLFITIFHRPFGKICFLVVLTTLSKLKWRVFLCQNLDRPWSFPCDAAFSAGPLRFACGTMTWMSLGTWKKCNQFLMYIKFVGTLHHFVVEYDEGVSFNASETRTIWNASCTILSFCDWIPINNQIWGTVIHFSASTYAFSGNDRLPKPGRLDDSKSSEFVEVGSCLGELFGCKNLFLLENPYLL